MPEKIKDILTSISEMDTVDIGEKITFDTNNALAT
jgi:hypothetical protein